MRTGCKHSLNVSPSGKLAMCELCGFVGRWRDGAWERVEPAASTPPSLGGGPFVVSEYVALPGDRIAVAAMDPVTGIMCGGRDDRKLAEGDAQALNAAYQLGKRRAEEAVRYANAHLISAAPDLLAACEAALAVCLDNSYVRAGIDALAPRLRAAIAKASGGGA